MLRLGYREVSTNYRVSVRVKLLVSADKVPCAGWHRPAAASWRCFWRPFCCIARYSQVGDAAICDWRSPWEKHLLVGAC